MSMTINSNVAVWVKYTQASKNGPADIQFFTSAFGSTIWQPDSLAYKSMTSYFLGVYNSTDEFNWHALTFWPKNSSQKIVSNVVESFVYPSTGGQALFQSTLFVKNINVQNVTPPEGMPNGPSFCVCNNNSTNEKGYVGMELTICAKPSGRSSRYLTSSDPKIPLLPSGTTDVPLRA